MSRIKTSIGIKRSLRSAVTMLAVLLLPAAASSAYPTLRLKPIGKSMTPLYSDGSRWAAYELRPGTTTVIDSRTGVTASRPAPSRCTGEVGGRRVGLIAVGSGDLLYGCSDLTTTDSSQQFVVENILTGVSHTITAELSIVNKIGAGGNARIEEVGTQWLAGIAEGYRSQSRIFLNWHTGQLITDYSEPASAAQETENLNAPGLLLPLCQPVRRIANFAEFNYTQTRFTSFAYEPPFAIADIASRLDDKTAESENKPIRLMHCGSAHSQTLPGPGASLQIGDGTISWIAPGKNGSGTMYATRLSYHGRRWHGPIFHLLGPKYPSHVKIAQTWTLQHTATTVYQSVPADEAEKGSILIYGIRLP